MLVYWNKRSKGEIYHFWDRISVRTMEVLQNSQKPCSGQWPARLRSFVADTMEWATDCTKASLKGLIQSTCRDSRCDLVWNCHIEVCELDIEAHVSISDGPGLDTVSSPWVSKAICNIIDCLRHPRETGSSGNTSVGDLCLSGPAGVLLSLWHLSC